MKEEPQASSGPSDDHAHTLAAPVLRFDLAAAAAELRRQGSDARGTPTGRTAVKEPSLRIVLFACRAGERLVEHRTSGPISVQVLEGSIRLRVGDRSVDLRQGELLMLEPGVPHDVDALEDAAFLLTIGRTTYAEVSDHHEPGGGMT